MNQRTIVLPADVIHFAITFADPLASALSNRLGQAGEQPSAVAQGTSTDTGETNVGDNGAGTNMQQPALGTYCDATDVLEAIASDARFTQRSLAAIQKYLSHIDPSSVADRVNTMRMDDELESRVRRNGETVYSAA